MFAQSFCFCFCFVLMISFVFVYLQYIFFFDYAIFFVFTALISLSPVQETRSNNSPMIYNPLCIVSVFITCPPSTNKYG